MGFVRDVFTADFGSIGRKYKYDNSGFTFGCSLSIK